MARWLQSPTSIHGNVGLIPGFTQWVKNLAMNCGVGQRCGGKKGQHLLNTYHCQTVF